MHRLQVEAPSRRVVVINAPLKRERIGTSRRDREHIAVVAEIIWTEHEIAGGIKQAHRKIIARQALRIEKVAIPSTGLESVQPRSNCLRHPLAGIGVGGAVGESGTTDFIEAPIRG